MTTFKQFLTESWLLEAKEDIIADKQKSAILDAFNKDRGTKPDINTALEVVNYLSQAGNPYIQWIVNRYIQGQFKLEDISRLEDDLKEFDRVRPRLYDKDINQFKSLKELYSVIDKFKYTDVKSTKQIKKDAKSEGADKLIDNAEILMYKVKTKEAAMLLGKGTRWCTAANKNNMFDDYNSKGPLFVIIDKGPNEKYQIHLPTSSCMDAEDEPCKLEHFLDGPTLTQVLTTLIKEDPSHIREFLEDFDGLVPYISEQDLVTIVKSDKYGYFIYEIPVNKRTKNICLAAFNVSTDAYQAFPEQFKTLDLSIKYAIKSLYDWECIPRKHIPIVREHLKKMREMNRGIDDWKRAKSFEKTVMGHIPPDQEHSTETSRILDDIKGNTIQTKQKLGGFKDYVQQLRQQKREMA
jgi:hypothetical protein